MISIISAYTNLDAHVSDLPVPGQWGHHEFGVTPAAFGVSTNEFNRVLRDVVALRVRSEWIDGTSEREGLDNVRVSKAPDAYWAWISQFFSGADLYDENLVGRLANPDGDGVNNWSEYIADTAPTNALDFLRFEHVWTTNGLCAMDFKTRPGRLYTVESADLLEATNTWTGRTNDIAGTGALMIYQTAPDGPQRYHRLKVRLGD